MRNILILLVCFSMFSVSSEAQDWSWRDKSDYSQILDNHLQPLYQFGFTFIPESSFENAGNTAVMEIDGDWEFAYFRDVLSGDIDLWFEFNTIMFINDADIGLPDQVGKMALDIGWAWRYSDGRAFQMRINPGIYTDFGETGMGTFFMPFSGAVLQSFNHDAAGILGVQIRPQFERFLMPIIGVHWEIGDLVKLEAALPSSRVILFHDYSWSGYLGLNWNNMSFDLEEGDMITVEDFRFYAGLTHRISDQVQFAGEFGRSFWREIEFDESDRPVEIDSQYYFRLAVHGSF